ncbi:MAG: phage tail tape measure protein [Allosphingosinicella sp.]|uniref:phage tail tape measure protein n=1 Tax=Allosphingosinicella sp. TaxID=2823234 RepID=UPI003958B11C
MSGDRNLRIQLLFDAIDRFSKPLRDLATGANNAGKEVQGTRKRILELGQAQASVGRMRELRAGLTESHGKLDETRRRIRDLRREMEQAGAPTKKLARELAAAEREEQRLVRTTQLQVEQLQKLTAKASAAGIDVNNLARSEERLGRELADSNRRLKEQEDRLERVQGARDRFENSKEFGEKLRGGGYRAIGAGVAIGAPLAVATAGAARFESQLTDIAQKADLTRAQAALMGREFDRLGPRVAQLPSRLAQGADVLMGMGATPRQAMEAIAPIGMAATAYKADVNDLATATWSALDNLKVPARETGRSLDVMAQAGKAGAFELKDMAQYFPALTASANALGQSGVPAVADLAAALQITRKGAGDASSAANNLQNLLNKINTKQTSDSFRRMGIDIGAALRVGAAAGKSPIETIVEQTIRATKGDMRKLSHLFTDAQVQAAIRPLVQNLALYREIRSDALAAQGSVETDFNERLGDAETKLERLKARGQVLGHTIGNNLLPHAKDLMDKLAELGNRAADWAERNPRLVATLAATAAVLAILLVTIGALSVAVGTILLPFAMLRFAMVVGGPAFLAFAKFMLAPLKLLPMLARGMLLVGTAVSKAGLMMLANPIVLLIAAIVAAVGLLAYAGYQIYKNWDGIKAWFSNFWSSMEGTTGGAIARIGAILGAFNPIGLLLMAVGKALSVLQVQFPEKFASLGRMAVQGLINGIRAMFPGLSAVMSTLSHLMPDAVKKALGIRSPSRVFMGIGGFVMEGLERGIGDGEDGPLARVRGVAARLAAAWSPPDDLKLAASTAPFHLPPAQLQDGDRRLEIQAPIVRLASPAAAVGAESGILGRLDAFLHNLSALKNEGPLARVDGLAARMAAAIAVGSAAPVAAAGPVAAPPPEASRSSSPRPLPPITINIHGAPGQSEADMARLMRQELQKLLREESARAASSFADDPDWER